MTRTGDILTVPEVGDTPTAPDRGAAIGRFLVLGTLGMGGMGMVVSAYDPDLDRKVAIKLLRSELFGGSDSDEAREALRREAQAMARVAHPNVVAVHEVGFLKDRGYVVMEHVEGGTLRPWLAQPRRWEATLAVLVEAGRGLAAAHRAGIVHHDFKPENVLIGADGRPRVTDFGLAGVASRAAGTKGYMAPEQVAGDATDARTDQFAFCVTVWEALQGARPAADAQPPADRKAPLWLFRVLARGLKRRDDDRWPSMDALLAAIRRPVGAVRRIAGAAAAVAVVAAAAYGSGRSGAPGPDCEHGAAKRLAGVWDAARRAQVGAAFAATALPYRDAVWRSASARLDDYSHAWADGYTEACRATAEGRQSAALLDLKMQCLEHRRGVLGALTRLWGEGEGQGMTTAALDAAIDAARGLPEIAECADARGLTEPVPPPRQPETLQRVQAVRARLAVVEALLLASRVTEAIAEAQAVRADAAATGWPRVMAEAALAEGRALNQRQDAAAGAVLREAVRQGGAARDARLTAQALLELVYQLDLAQKNEQSLLVGDLADGVISGLDNDVRLRTEWLRRRGEVLLSLGRYRDAEGVLRAARIRAIALLGDRDPEATLCLADVARALDGQGDFAGARAAGEQALAETLRLFGDEHPRLAPILGNLATEAMSLDDLEGAAAYDRRVLAIEERSVGPEAPKTAGTLNNLATVEMLRGRLEEAQALLERVRVIREKQGPDHPYVAFALHNLATVRRKQGHMDEALALLRRAIAIKTKAYGPAHPSVALTRQELGKSLAVAGRFEEALAELRQVVEIRRNALGDKHLDTIWARTLVAASLQALGRCAEARPLVAGEAPGEPDSSRVARALEVRAACDLADGRAAAALPLLERALSLHATDVVPVLRGAARWQQARALAALGRRAQAAAAARVAADELASDADGARDLAAARAWLATR